MAVFSSLTSFSARIKNPHRKAFEKSYTMNAYDYTYDYRDYDKNRTFFDIIAHPSDLWNDIKSINKEGRWSLQVITFIKR